jgi:hypothetical protein
VVRTLTWALVLAAAQALPGQPSNASAKRPPPLRPGLSWADADAVQAKLDGVAARQRQGRAVPALTVTDEELNSYVNLSLAQQIPKGVSDLELQIADDRLLARAVVDIAPFRAQVRPAGGWSPLSLLPDVVPVNVKARLVAVQDGFASLELEEVRLSSIPLPPGVLAQVVAASTKAPSRPDGFDLLAPFRLPYSVRRIRLSVGQAILEFLPPAKGAAAR